MLVPDLLRPGMDSSAKTRLGTPKVLVLLAAFNGSNWIRDQLQSVLDQHGVDVQIAIRDDGSTDHTTAVVQQFLNGGRVELSIADTPTGSAAQNFFSLIRDTSTDGFDFVAFADQDDIWDRDKLSRACNSIRQGSAAGYSSPVVAFWSDGKEQILPQEDQTTAADFLFEGAGQGCTFVLAAGFFNRVRTFIADNQHLTRRVQFHDWATYALARTWGETWHFDATPTMRYRQHHDNQLGARSGMHGFSKRLHLLKSGWYKAQLLALADLCMAAAPGNPGLIEWQKLLQQPDSLKRRAKMARFCRQAGRRRKTDRIGLVIASIAGWI
jgi:rhamnosyltransferase